MSDQEIRESDDTEGQKQRHGLGETDEDVEGQRKHTLDDTEDDTEGQKQRHALSQAEDDTEGQVKRH